MEITEVRIKLMEDAGDRLQAFCSITLDDCFVIRDLKIIEGSNGPFVAMPSRKLTARCPKCGSKNHLRASYCNHCGLKLDEIRADKDDEGRAKLYADVAHPINSACREKLQNRVIEAYHEEVRRSQMPGYVSTYEDFDQEDYYVAPADEPSTVPAPHAPAAKPRRQKPSGSKGQPRGPHAAPKHEQPKPQTPKDTEFGEGIL